MWWNGLEEHLGLIITLFGVIATALAFLVWTDYLSTKRKLSAIEHNYIAKFEEVKDEIRKSERGILAGVASFELAMAKEYIRKGECMLLHSSVTKRLPEEE
jgi:hypothetical protein